MRRSSKAQGNGAAGGGKTGDVVGAHGPGEGELHKRLGLMAVQTDLIRSRLASAQGVENVAKQVGLPSAARRVRKSGVQLLVELGSHWITGQTPTLVTCLQPVALPWARATHQLTWVDNPEAWRDQPPDANSAVDL